MTELSYIHVWFDKYKYLACGCAQFICDKLEGRFRIKILSNERPTFPPPVSPIVRIAKVNRGPVKWYQVYSRPNVDSIEVLQSWPACTSSVFRRILRKSQRMNMELHREKSNSVPSRMGSILYPEHRNSMLERATKKTWSVWTVLINRACTSSRYDYAVQVWKIASGHSLFLAVRSVILGEHEETNYLSKLKESKFTIPSTTVTFLRQCRLL